MFPHKYHYRKTSRCIRPKHVRAFYRGYLHRSQTGQAAMKAIGAENFVLTVTVGKEKRTSAHVQIDRRHRKTVSTGASAVIASQRH
jgi:hypothetical protein